LLVFTILLFYGAGFILGGYMSGHSKWSTIKRKKGAADAARGKVFTRLIKEITVAAKMGGGDPETNPRLRSAVQAGKGANMPSANIEKAIKKGTGELPGVVYEEVTYEGYGPGGIALFLDCMTDNKNRTVAELRHLLTKYNGSLGETGSVAWMFTKQGVISIPIKNSTEDDVMMAALDAGAEDIQVDDDYISVTCQPADFEAVKKALEENDIKYDSAQISMEPSNTVKVEGKMAHSVLKLMDHLEDHEDIQNLYSNFDIDDEVLQAINN
jgi:YebC/PmpR family DNA-binding regulatory protein